MSCEKDKVLSVLEAYKIALSITKDKRREFSSSMRSFLIGYTAQGLVFACFYPIMSSLFGDEVSVKKAFMWFLVMVLIALIDFFGNWSGHRFDFTGCIVDITHNLRMELGDKLKTMPLERMYQYKTGTLNFIFSTGVDMTVLHMGVIGSMLMQAAIPAFFVIVLTILMQWQIGIVVAVLFLVAIPGYKWRRRGLKQDKAESSKAHSRIESDILEYVQGLPVLRAMNQTGESSSKLQESVIVLKKTQSKGVFAGVAPIMFMSSVVEAGLVLLLIYGIYLNNSGNLPLTFLAAMLVIFTRFSEPLSNFSNVVAVVDLMDCFFKDIKELLSIKNLEVKLPEAMPDGYDIEFNNVSFSYLGEQQKALNNISFSMPSGKLTAIVGPSGSGKTTITKLIMRYADPSEGNVSIGKAELTHFSQDKLMGMVSVVFQDVYLFDDTVLNNIRIGNPEATDEQVKQAAEKAFCHEFITRLPEGYNTIIGDIGGNLSGGEKQRISIARAILKDAPIVLLDEPTAALDTESEVAVQSAISSLVADKTVVVIAHRLSTIASADNIMVVEDGGVTEQGTHDELISMKGRYCSMWEAQQRAKEWHLT